MTKKKQPVQLDLFLKKDKYNINGDNVKPQDLSGYMDEQYSRANNHDTRGSDRLEARKKLVKTKKILKIKLDEDDKSIIKDKNKKIKDKINTKNKLKKLHTKASKMAGFLTKRMGVKGKILNKLISAKSLKGIGDVTNAMVKKVKNKKSKFTGPLIKKKSGGRLNSGTSFISSLYKDKT